MNKKQSRAEEVVKLFNKGLYCSQAMFSTYCEDYGMDKETAIKVSCGLSAGMARVGSTCGAVTGAYLVISLKYGNTSPEDKPSIEKTFAVMREFNRSFIEKHASTNCRKLLGIDLDGEDKVHANERVQAICPMVVRDAALLLESVLWKDE